MSKPVPTKDQRGAAARFFFRDLPSHVTAWVDEGVNTDDVDDDVLTMAALLASRENALAKQVANLEALIAGQQAGADALREENARLRTHLEETTETSTALTTQLQARIADLEAQAVHDKANADCIIGSLKRLRERDKAKATGEGGVVIIGHRPGDGSVHVLSSGMRWLPAAEAEAAVLTREVADGIKLYGHEPNPNIEIVPVGAYLKAVNTNNWALVLPSKACGGCGETNPEKRCLGCGHDFGSGPFNANPVPTEEQRQAALKACTRRVIGVPDSAMATAEDVANLLASREKRPGPTAPAIVPWVNRNGEWTTEGALETMVAGNNMRVAALEAVRPVIERVVEAAAMNYSDGYRAIYKAGGYELVEKARQALNIPVPAKDEDT